jgi:hypothetical protein
VGQCGWALDEASEELKSDRDIVLLAMAQDGDALQCAAEFGWHTGTGIQM